MLNSIDEASNYISDKKPVEDYPYDDCRWIEDNFSDYDQDSEEYCQNMNNLNYRRKKDGRCYPKSLPANWDEMWDYSFGRSYGIKLRRKIITELYNDNLSSDLFWALMKGDW
jgi:hypothetical protein